jgi:hypothetical protein
VGIVELSLMIVEELQRLLKLPTRAACSNSSKQRKTPLVATMPMIHTLSLRLFLFTRKCFCLCKEPRARAQREALTQNARE